VKYEHIHRQQQAGAAVSLRTACRLLDVSPSGYYKWLAGGRQSKTECRNAEIVRKIEDIHKASRGRYGSPKIFEQLKALGVSVSKRKVEVLMRRHGLRSKTAKRFRATTNSKHRLPVADNILSREFSPKAPDRVWAADITYVPTKDGWLYLAVVIDLFSRRIVGWAMDSRMTAELTNSALVMAVAQRRPKPGLIHHSDRGVQYASKEYQRLLTEAGAVSSMSRKGNCWDNAPVESLFRSLKTELVHHERFATQGAAKKAIFEWIEVFYNRQRLHSSLGYVTPAEYEKRRVS
jgi:transposase InsO family protein